MYNMAGKDTNDDMDDWETLDENGELDKQIDALKAKQEGFKKETQSKPQNNDSCNLEFGKVTILQNNEQRTQYTPTIKLLKRDPASNAVSSQTAMGDRKPSYKSLQQREQEYAEARKRILGSPDSQANEEGNVAKTAGSPNTSTIQTLGSGNNTTRQPNGPDPNSKGFQPRQSTTVTPTSNYTTTVNVNSS